MAKVNQEEYELLKGLDDYWKWKWIARDSAGLDSDNLHSYSEKPHKDYGTKTWSTDDNRSFLIYEQPFQFIQWEDESPYNIQELIEEYEGEIKVQGTDILFKSLGEPQSPPIPSSESEEKEVKKDIEWLKEELNYFIKFETLDEREIGFELAIREVIDLLSQLDEPEVLSQEDNINIVLDDLKEHIKEQQSLSQNVGMAHTPAGNDTHYRQYDYVLECINEYEPSDDLQNLLMPKQVLPAIPKFVAEWIEEMKQDERPLYSVMCSLMNKTNYEWAAWESANKNFSEIVAQAWLYGFAVKEEPKYYALIKGHENMDSDDKYWNYCIADESLDIGDNSVHADVLAEYVLSATKDEWENLGINDDNADFVKVKELEE